MPRNRRRTASPRRAPTKKARRKPTASTRPRPKRAVAKPRRKAPPTVAPKPTPPTAATDGTKAAPEIAEGSPQWDAYDLLLRKLESTYAPLDEIHRRLDEDKMQGRRFSEILNRVADLFGIPTFYAGVVVRTYGGYAPETLEATDLREFYEKWSKKKRREFRPQPGLHVHPDDAQRPPV